MKINGQQAVRDGWMDGWMDGWVDAEMASQLLYQSLFKILCANWNMQVVSLVFGLSCSLVGHTSIKQHRR